MANTSVTVTVSLPAVSADDRHSVAGLLVVVGAEDGSEGVPVPIEELGVRIQATASFLPPETVFCRNE